MTEDEAKSKWCPHARVPAHLSEVAMNRSADGAVREGSNCIASACMAWRWKYEQTNKNLHSQAMWPPVEPIYRQTESGYCGLAGSSQ